MRDALRSIIVVLTARTPLERQRWYRRVRSLRAAGTPLVRAIRTADIACELDRIEERMHIRRWRDAGSVEA